MTRTCSPFRFKPIVGKSFRSLTSRKAVPRVCQPHVRSRMGSNELVCSERKSGVQTFVRAILCEPYCAVSEIYAASYSVIFVTEFRPIVLIMSSEAECTAIITMVAIRTLLPAYWPGCIHVLRSKSDTYGALPFIMLASF